MRHQKLMVVIIVLLSIFSINAQITEKFECHIFNHQGKTMAYRLFAPEAYSDSAAYPLVLTLHGAGEKGDDNKKQIERHPLATVWAEPHNQAAHPCIFVSPQCESASHWANESELLLSLVDSLIFKFFIDTNRLYITGLSMDGFGSFKVLVEYPYKFAAAVPMSGG